MSPTLPRSFDLLKSRLGIKYIETESECDISLAIYAKQMQAQPSQDRQKTNRNPSSTKIKDSNM